MESEVIIHSMFLIFPIILHRYIPSLLYCVTELYGVLRTNCIQALTSRVQHLTNEQHQEIYKQIQGKDLERLLTHRYGFTLCTLKSFFKKILRNHNPMFLKFNRLAC